MAGETIYTGISLSNTSPYPARLESVRLLGATPGFRLVDARLSRPGTTGALAGFMAGTGSGVDELRLDTDYQPLPAVLGGNNPIGDGRLTLVATASEPGEYSYEAVAVDYRVGPFSFSAVHHQALAVCLGPLPPGTACSVDSKY